jgi:hypothetical protein
MSKLKALFATLLIAVVGFVGYAAVSGDNASAESVECGDNAIIRCGAMTSGELKKKYADNDRGLKAIYSYYNIDASDIANSGSAKIGYVHTNGDVTVNGKVVATNANTVGRSAALGGKKVNANGHTVYEGPDRLKSTLSAFVFYNSDGSFKSAVLRVCGNPVKAKPPVKPPVPVYSCDLLSATKLSRTEYEFVTKATAKNGASIKNYSYAFGDGSSTTTGSSTRHSYVKDGTYTATVTVNMTVNGSVKAVTSETCKATVTVSPTPVTPLTYCDTDTKKIVENVMPNDVKPSYTTDLSKCKEPPVVPELPETGINEVIGGGFGAGALTLASYYYYASRRML